MWRKWISIAMITSILGTSMSISVLGDYERGEDWNASYETASSSNAEIVEEIVDEDGVLEKYIGNGGDVVIPDGVISMVSYSSCFAMTSGTWI